MTPNNALQPAVTRLHFGPVGRAGSRQRLNDGVRQHMEDA